MILNVSLVLVIDVQRLHNAVHGVFLSVSRHSDKRFDDPLSCGVLRGELLEALTQCALADARGTSTAAGPTCAASVKAAWRFNPCLRSFKRVPTSSDLKKVNAATSERAQPASLTVSTPAMARDSVPSLHALDKPEKLQDLLKEDRGDDCLSCKVVGAFQPI